MKDRILVVGSLNMDYVYKARKDSKKLKTPNTSICGGKAINQALSLKRNGFEVEILSVLAKDDNARKTKKFLDKNHITLHDVSCKAVDKSDFSKVFVDKTGSYVVKKKCYSLSNFSKKKIKEYLEGRDDICCIVSFAKIKKEIFSFLIEYSCKNSILSVFTPCPPWKLSIKSAFDFELLKKVSFVFANKYEALKITGAKDIKSAILILKNMIVTDGENGVFYFEDNEVKHLPAMTPSKLVDTTGAGDVFCGFFMSKFIETKNKTLAVKYGIVAATLKLEKLGATRGVPKKRKAKIVLKKFLK